ncbi:MAG: hypothetical protein DRQ40_08580 [Gammaproteobacteria bacterium]|nr:MAG: hypothetical protein DRQ40_08580 [Gammaproteobacteria bacterium]
MGKKQTPQEWKKHIEAQKQGAQTRVDYCRNHGLALSSFDYWSAKIRKQQNEVTEKLVRIGAVEEPSGKDEHCSLILHIGSGYRLEIPSPVNQDDVKRVLDILQAL